MESNAKPVTEQMIETAHLAILRNDCAGAETILQQVLSIEPGNADAQNMLHTLQNQPKDYRTDDARIRQEQNESWRRDVAYKDEQLKQSVIRSIFDAFWRFIFRW